MPRLIDFTSATLTETNLMRAFDRLNTELSQATTMATSALLELPVWTGTHQGADLNTAIDRIDSKITNAAVLVGKAGVGLTSRVQDFTTGTHDVTRLHAELDRLHARIAALATRSPSETLPAYPITVHRTGGASYIGTAGTLTTDTAGNARHGLPYVIRRNLLASSGNLSAWTQTSITLALNSAANPISGAMDAATVSDTTTSATGSLASANVTIAADTATYAFSTYVLKDSTTSRFPALRVALGSNRTLVQINTSTGALATEPSAAVSVTIPASATLTSDGLWWRITGTFAGDGVSTTASLWFVPASSTTLTGATSVTATGSATFYGPQLEKASAVTTYQPTNASGVDLTNPLNGAGLVLEGQSTNLLTSNQATCTDTLGNTTGFSASGGNVIGTGATLASSTAQVFQGAKSLAVTTLGSGSGFQGVETTGVSAAANTVHTASALVKAPAGRAMAFKLYDYTNTVSGTAYTWTATGGWDYVTAQITTGALAVTDLRADVYSNNVIAAATYYVDALKVEANPFATSWVDGTRSPDLCGIVSPHNLAKYSQGFGQSVWVADVVGCVTSTTATAHDGTATGATVNMAAGSGAGIHQDISGITFDGTTRTFSIWIKGAAGGESVQVILARADTGAGVATSSVTVTSSFQRYAITASANNGAGVRILVARNQTASSFTASGAQLVEGSHPGVYVRTLDQAVANVSVVMDPAWSQNGFIEWDSVNPPNVANTTAFYHLGSGVSGYPGLYRYQWGTTTKMAVITRRAVDGTEPGSYRDVGGIPDSFYSGSKVRSRLEWGNRVNKATGVRTMPLTLTIDGTVLFSKDFASGTGASSWTPVTDPSTLISGGLVNATIGAVYAGLLPIPDGYTS